MIIKKLTTIINIITFKKNWYIDLLVIFVVSYLTAFIFVKINSDNFVISVIGLLILCSYIFGYEIQTVNNVLNNNYCLPDWNKDFVKYYKQSGRWYLACSCNTFLFSTIFLIISSIVKLVLYTLNYAYFNSSTVIAQNIYECIELLHHLFIFSIIMPLATINYSKRLKFKDAFRYKTIWTDFKQKFKIYIFDIAIAILCNRVFILLIDVRVIDLYFVLAILPFLYLLVNLSFALTSKIEGEASDVVVTY